MQNGAQESKKIRRKARHRSPVTLAAARQTLHSHRMVDDSDIRTSADGWRSFLGKLAQLRREAEQRGLDEAARTVTDTAVTVAERLKHHTQ
jgi:hypothetical protein